MFHKTLVGNHYGLLGSADFCAIIPVGATYSYDLHGNITSISTGDSSVSPRIFSYIGNHLTDATYDTNGNTTADPSSGLQEVSYNVLNLPARIIKFPGEEAGTGAAPDTVSYLYSATGTKLSETVSSGQTETQGPVVTDYIGRMILRDGRLSMIQVDGGYVAADSASYASFPTGYDAPQDGSLPAVYHFYYRDHLGSNRAVADIYGHVVQRSHFDPYGQVIEVESGGGINPGGDEIIIKDPVIELDSLTEINLSSGDSGSDVVNVLPGGGTLIPTAFTPIDGVITGTLSNPYRYSGQELLSTAGLDLYDYGARQYSLSRPSWLQIDPLCEQYYSVSPYSFCAGNPVNLIDTDGRIIREAIFYYLTAQGLERYGGNNTVKSIGFAMQRPLTASKIGPVIHNSNNISTVSARFATREEILYGSIPSKQIEQGSEAGAFRHTLWQAIITSNYGEDIATRVGNAHEENTMSVDLSSRVFHSLNEADVVVDMLNNQIGRSITESKSKEASKDLALKTLEVFRTKGLYTAHQTDDNTWIVKRSILDEKRADKLEQAFNQLNNNARYPYEE